MKNIEEFRNFYLEKKDEYKSKKYLINSNNNLVDFHEEYSIERLKNLSLNDYAQGNDNKDSLCYKMEFGKYKNAGPGIGGSTAYKYGIYFSKDKNAYVTREGICSDPEATWNVIKNDIIRLIYSINAAQEVNQIIDDPQTLKGMSMFLAKICFCYLPTKLISIAGKKQLKKALDTFDIRYDANSSAVKMSFLINKIIRESIREASSEIPAVLGHMIWDFCEVKEHANNNYEKNVTRTWIYAPGVNGNKWDEYYREGIIGLGWNELGDLRQYETKNEIRNKLYALDPHSSQKNNALANWEFANVMNIGDIVYAKRGTDTIIGKGIITSEYQYDESKDYKSYRNIKWVSNEEKDHRGEFGSKIVQKTLTDITKYPEYVERLNELYGGEEQETSKYTKYEFLNEVIISEETYDNIINTLERKKNIILQGVPGVGKTFSAKKIMYSMMNMEDDSRIKMVQFHQSYSYEDFIQGFRPNEDGKFELVDGIFYQLVQEARKEYERATIQNEEPKKYCMIIDEINRGNLSKVFGELMMLIESDKRDPKWSVKLTYSDDDFYIPSNLYIIGTMNTADRSLAMIDYALRRRFAFIDMKTAFENDETLKKLKKLLVEKEEVDNNFVDKIIIAFKRLNSYMKENLSENFTIGHSYLIGQFADQDEYRDTYENIVEYEIIPLLKEYFYDNEEKVEEARRIIENI